MSSFQVSNLAERHTHFCWLGLTFVFSLECLNRSFATDSRRVLLPCVGYENEKKKKAVEIFSFFTERKTEIKNREIRRR